VDRFVGVIEKAGRPHPVIRLRDGVLWLETIKYAAELPSSVVAIKAIRLAGAEPMRAVLLSGLPITEGCHLDIRLLAIVDDSSLRLPPIAVAVPCADPMMAGVSTVEELPQSFKEALRSTLAILGYGDSQLASVESLDEVLDGYLRSRSKAKAGPSNPRGQSTVGSRAISHLPWRFQEYLEDLLVPGERILALAVRRPFEMKTSGFLAGKRRYLEGACIITDRGILFFEDALVPDLTMVQWGYHARSAAAERIVEAVPKREGNGIWLTVLLEALGGSYRWSIPFASDQTADVEELAAFLSRFCQPGEYRYALQRRPDLTSEVPQSTLAATRSSTLLQVLRESPLQLGLADSSTGGRRMLAATPTALTVVREEGHEIWVERRIPYQSIALLDLRRSVTGYWLECIFRETTDFRTCRLTFASEEFAGFHGVFLAARQGMSMAVAAPIPTLNCEGLNVGNS
jgi:hypothetical protein